MFICMHCLLQMIWWRVIFENVKWVAANAPLFGLIHGSPTCMNEGVVLVVIDVSWLCIKSDSFKFRGWEAIWVSSKVHHLEDEMMFLMEMCRSFKGSNSWCELQHDSDDYQLHVFRVLMERMKTFFYEWRRILAWTNWCFSSQWSFSLQGVMLCNHNLISLHKSLYLTNFF